MNARQRRGALFVILATVIAAVVFFTVAGYVANVSNQVGGRVTVYRAASTIEPFQELSEGNLEAVRVPERWTSPTAKLRVDEIRGRKVGFRLAKGTTLTSDMLVPPSDLSPTEREVAINVSPVTGLAGRARPGDQVDIFAVFGDVPGVAKQVRVLVQNARIVSVGGRQSVREQEREATSSGERDVVPVTLALEANEALAVTFASAFAEEVRLIGLPTGDTLNRTGELGLFDATGVGGQPVPEGTR